MADRRSGIDLVAVYNTHTAITCCNGNCSTIYRLNLSRNKEEEEQRERGKNERNENRFHAQIDLAFIAGPFNLWQPATAIKSRANNAHKNFRLAI